MTTEEYVKELQEGKVTVDHLDEEMTVAFMLTSMIAGKFALSLAVKLGVDLDSGSRTEREEIAHAIGVRATYHVAVASAEYVKLVQACEVRGTKAAMLISLASSVAERLVKEVFPTAFDEYHGESADSSLLEILHGLVADDMKVDSFLFTDSGDDGVMN